MSYLKQLNLKIWKDSLSKPAGELTRKKEWRIYGKAAGSFNDDFVNSQTVQQ